LDKASQRYFFLFGSKKNLFARDLWVEHNGYRRKRPFRHFAALIISVAADGPQNGEIDTSKPSKITL
jgi:hypothetical protein